MNTNEFSKVNTEKDNLMCPTWISVPQRNSEGVVIGMTPIRYDQFVLKLFKVMEFGRMVGHAAAGIANEAGELNGVTKKHLYYDQEMDIPHLIEELGDLRFFMQAMQNLYGISDATVLQANGVKLAERYMNLEYSDAQAILRRDKPAGDRG